MLWTLQQELESHMLKEEQILFPMLQRGIKTPQTDGPISVMRYEHDQHGDALARLSALTNDITPPATPATPGVRCTAGWKSCTAI